MVVPTAAYAAVPSVHLGREAAVVDAVPEKSVLNPDDPTLDIKVTNLTGRPAELRGWLNGTPAQVAVPAHTAIVRLTFPQMTEGRASLKLTVTAEGTEDTEVHEVLLLMPRHGYGHVSATPTPSGGVGGTPTPSHSASTRPSWSKSPSGKPSKSPTWKPSKTPSWSKSPWGSHTPMPSASHSELPKTGAEVRSYVLLGGGLLVFGLFVLGLAWALGRRTLNETARER